MEKKRGKWMIYKKIWKWRDFYFHKVLRRHVFEKYLHRDIIMPVYAGKVVWRIQKTNDWIATQINSGKPFMVARFGNTELQTVVSVLDQEIMGNEYSKERFDKWFSNLVELSGFFPNDENLASEFKDVILEACEQVDLLAMWHCHMEDYVITEYMKEVNITYLTRIEPWRCSRPWTRALKGKKVLVIHPFEDSIKEQYSKRKQLFDNPEILPEFELLTIKAVQTIAGTKDARFDDWFEALEYMYQQAMSVDFDIAIIGCGAYGMPLAAKLKHAGRQVIHMGGATQLLFGIKGKRWIESPTETKLKFNDAWKYPDQSEVPANAQKVEGGCYWK